MYDLNSINQALDSLSEQSYKEFFAKLTNTKYELTGIRLPNLRKLAKQIIKNNAYRQFLDIKDISRYEHAMLYGIVACSLNVDFKQKTQYLNDVADIIDDWGVCDSACATLKAKSDDMFYYLKSMALSEKLWHARFGLVSIMNNYLCDKYREEIIDIFKNAKAKGYYFDMASGWFICTAESKIKDFGLQLLSLKEVNTTAKKMALQKMRDSRLIDSETVQNAKNIISITS